MEQAQSYVVSMAPWIGVISQLIGWTFFLIVLGILKKFISHGLSIAIGEFLLKQADQETRERMCRWFGNGNTILEALADIDRGLNRQIEQDRGQRR